MSNRSEGPDRKVERGYSEEATRTPLTPTEEEASKRPPSLPPGFVGSEEPDCGDRYELDAAFKRLEELNPDDFE
ncbi:MAG TPA: hypothetical protein VFV66_32115 [Nonomuraea sp.]|nr:hypothetical protein [Nonomuraea sp.]